MNLCSESASDVVCHSLLACTRKPSVVHLECGRTLVTNTPCACACWVAVGSGRVAPQQAQEKGVYLGGWIGSMQEVWVGVQDLWQKRAGRGGLCSTDGEFLSPTLSLSLSLPFYDDSLVLTLAISVRLPPNSVASTPVIFISSS